MFLKALSNGMLRSDRATEPSATGTISDAVTQMTVFWTAVANLDG
jgi:hypothetical protein